jgi:hypothetical protein
LPRYTRSVLCPNLDSVAKTNAVWPMTRFRLYHRNSKEWRHNIENRKSDFGKSIKFGGIAVLVLGIVMAGRWFLFPASPVSYAASGSGQTSGSLAVVKGDVQEVTIDLKPGAYAPIVVQKGIPVRFNIRAEKKDINSCNGTVVIPEYDLQMVLKPGDNILEFTPDKAGSIPYSCWMGMVTSTIQVVDDISSTDASAVTAPAAGGIIPRMPCCQRQ